MFVGRTKPGMRSETSKSVSQVGGTCRAIEGSRRGSRQICFSSVNRPYASNEWMELTDARLSQWLIAGLTLATTLSKVPFPIRSTPVGRWVRTVNLGVVHAVADHTDKWHGVGSSRRLSEPGEVVDSLFTNIIVNLENKNDRSVIVRK